MSEELVHYFQTRLPAMLDGAVQQGSGRVGLIRRARASLRKGRTAPGHLPMEILRETLDTVAATAASAAGTAKTLAGAVSVGPNHARVWWDERALETLGSVLAQPGEPRLVLRFYDITGIAPDENRWHETFDIDVQPEETGRTVQFWASDKTYAIDLGCIHADGRFLRLARTNEITLPRSGKGAPATGETANSRLPRPGDKKAVYTAPDAAAAEWAALRPDHERRDRDAELTVHMLYRAFLLEGPRALRRVPALARRDAEVLKSEFAARQLRRAERATAGSVSAVIVHRLDAAADRAAGSGMAMTNLPVLVRAARAQDAVVRHVDNESVRFLGEDEEISAALSAAPVFEAARALRESLAKLSDISPTRRRCFPATVADASQIFDAAETERLLRAGGRVARMSLALEDSLRASSLS